MADIPRADTTGSCFLAVENFTKFVEYAPCRTGGLEVSDDLLRHCPIEVVLK